MASIRKRTWVSSKGKKQTRWLVDHRDAFGRRKAKQFKSLEEAREWAERTDLRAPASHPTQMTVAEAGQAWFERGEAEELERSTLRSYRHAIDQLIGPFLGHISLSELTRQQIIVFRKELAAAKSPASARRAVHILKMVLSYAEDSGWVTQSVARKVKSTPSARHRIGVRRDGVRVMSLSELRKIFKACDRKTGGGKPRMRVRTRLLLWVLAGTGLRPSEARGLAWENVDLEKCTIEVVRRADAWNNIGPCKSAAGFRTVPISSELASELSKWKKICPASDDNLVFPTSTGAPITHRNLGREWRKLLLAAGVTKTITLADGTQRPEPLYRLYDLRHFRASWWIFQRTDLKRLTTWLGHSSIQITIDNYGHIITDAESSDVILSDLEDVLFAEATNVQHELQFPLMSDGNA